MQRDFSRQTGFCSLATAAIFVSCLITATTAQDQPLARLTPLPGVRDVERPEALISASHWMRGLYMAAEPGELRPHLVSVVPDAWRGSTLCVRAVTINGRYEFTAEYPVPPDWSQGPAAEFDYPTAFDTAWSAATPNNSGVAISRGACTVQDTGPSEYIPALWNSSATDLVGSDGGKLVVNLHARSAQEVVAKARLADTDLPVQCHAVDQPDAAQFNFTCTIDVPSGSTGEIVFDYVRLNNGRKSDTRSAHFLLADK
jgi:hypothetical protein